MIELVRKGRRLYGAYVKTSRSLIYCAFRNPGELFLDGKPGEFRSIAQGLQDGRAAWAIDDSTLMSAKRKGCRYIAVFVRKLNWYFIVELEAFYDPKRYYRRNYSTRGGADQRYMSVVHWTQKNCPVQFR